MTDPRVDPVSGNEIPPGAEAEEVRDDIPVMASENEYIIPANVVRYIGLKNIEKLVNEAKEALGDTSESGPEEEEDELPFDINELEADEDDDEVRHFAEGGVITDNEFRGFNSDEDTYTGVKALKNKDGDTIYVPYFNGKPLYPVEGYTEQPETKEEEKQRTPQIDQEKGGLEVSSDSDETRKFVDDNRSALAGSPDDWTVDDFTNYAKSKTEPTGKIIGGIVSMLPGGKLALGARNSYLNSASARVLDQMLETGVDQKGTPLTEDQIGQLNQVKTSLVEQMGTTSKLNLSPIDKLADVFDKFSNFVSDRPSAAGLTSTAGEPRSALSNDWTSSSFSTAGQTSQSYGSDSSENAATTSSSRGLGSDIGRDPSKGPSEGSMASGGQYNKGGLITRRKKTK